MAAAPTQFLCRSLSAASWRAGIAGSAHREQRAGRLAPDPAATPKRRQV